MFGQPVGVRQHHVAALAVHHVGPHVVSQIAEILDIVEAVNGGKSGLRASLVVDRRKPDQARICVAY